MLYPKEDRLNHTLIFACRTCQFSEPAASSCVYRNNLSNTVGETAGVTQDVGSDPTVGHSASAPAAAAAAAPTSSAVSESNSLSVLCMLCGEPIICPLGTCNAGTNREVKGDLFYVDHVDMGLSEEEEEETVGKHVKSPKHGGNGKKKKDKHQHA